MARRIKQPEGYHRQQIADAASVLFLQNGIETTTMDEIAKVSGYSKATLYVYFKNKEELVAQLAFESLQMLYNHICGALEEEFTVKEQYWALCGQLTEYYKTYPFYFEMALGEIPFAQNQPGVGASTIADQIYEVGECINDRIAQMIHKGMKEGIFRPNLDVIYTVLAFWASISGIILLAAKKKEYLAARFSGSADVFMDYGFHLLYQSIEKRN